MWRLVAVGWLHQHLPRIVVPSPRVRCQTLQAYTEMATQRKCSLLTRDDVCRYPKPSHPKLINPSPCMNPEALLLPIVRNFLRHQRYSRNPRPKAIHPKRPLPELSVNKTCLNKLNQVLNSNIPQSLRNLKPSISPTSLKFFRPA